MKRICSFVIMLVLIISLCACGKVDITMQDIYDAGLTEALLKNHQSVRIRDELDGEFWYEKYLTKDYAFEYIPDEESDWVEFVSDDACYCALNDVYVRYVSITPDGVSDFANYRAKYYSSVIFGEDTVYETIESISKKDGRITVTSVLSQKNLEILAEDGVTAGKFEYVLDAKTHDFISLSGDYTYEDGSIYHMASEISYDAEASEILKTILEYVNQTENLRNITVVSNPGTEEEVSHSVQVPKGLVIGLRYNEDSSYVFEPYTDAACTEVYDPYADTDSDLTIYVKWTE